MFEPFGLSLSKSIGLSTSSRRTELIHKAESISHVRNHVDGAICPRPADMIGAGTEPEDSFIS